MLESHYQPHACCVPQIHERLQRERVLRDTEMDVAVRLSHLIGHLGSSILRPGRHG
jgi:hypothetical protein